MRIHPRNAFGLVIVVMLVTGHRLPAPISEETPAPQPAATAKPRPKVVIVKSKPKPTPISFAGTWTGVTSGACTNDGVNHSYNFTMTISADERTVSWQFGGQSYQHPCYRAGDTIRWDDTNDAATSTTSLRISANGRTLTYLGKSTITTWPLEGVVCTSTGVLTKR
jgi:hypothetical protein